MTRLNQPSVKSRPCAGSLGSRSLIDVLKPRAIKGRHFGLHRRSVTDCDGVDDRLHSITARLVRPAGSSGSNVYIEPDDLVMDKPFDFVPGDDEDPSL